MSLSPSAQRMQAGNPRLADAPGTSTSGLKPPAIPAPSGLLIPMKRRPTEQCALALNLTAMAAICLLCTDRLRWYFGARSPRDDQCLDPITCSLSDLSLVCRRLTVLFDINGVLIRAKSVKERKQKGLHVFDPRPGLQHLLSLWPHCTLGLFTSATLPTMGSRRCSLLHHLWHDPAAAVRAGIHRSFHHSKAHPFLGSLAIVRIVCRSRCKLWAYSRVCKGPTASSNMHFAVTTAGQTRSGENTGATNGIRSNLSPATCSTFGAQFSSTIRSEKP